MKKHLFFLLIFLQGSLLHAQNKYPGIIWAKEILQWQDYQETERIQGGHALARTYMKLQADIPDSAIVTARGNEVRIEIYALMIPAFSYVKKGNANQAVLAHEQMHFDIEELFARQLRKAIAEDTFTLKTYKKEIRKIEKQIWHDLREMQDDYDATHRSTDKGHNWWARTIKESLDELEAYKNQRLVIIVL